MRDVLLKLPNLHKADETRMKYRRLRQRLKSRWTRWSVGLSLAWMPQV